MYHFFEKDVVHEVLDSKKEIPFKQVITLDYFQHNMINFLTHAPNYFQTNCYMCGSLTNYQASFNIPMYL